MNATETMQGRTRRKVPVGRIVLIAIALFLVVEPVIMYRSLVNQRAQRQFLRAPAALPAGEPGK
jgi:hypothetical protein